MFFFYGNYYILYCRKITYIKLKWFYAATLKLFCNYPLQSFYICSIDNCTFLCEKDCCSLSYSGTSSTGAVKINKDLGQDIEGRHVIIVEDILDSGVTLSYLKHYLLGRKPASITIATLLDKPARRKSDIVADYSCFEVPDAFVVGYGLDYNENYRNLPYIGILKPEVYE